MRPKVKLANLFETEFNIAISNRDSCAKKLFSRTYLFGSCPKLYKSRFQS